MSLKPLDVVHNALDSQIIVLLKDGREYRGILKGYDIHMNLVLQNAEELKDGKPIKKLGLIVIRGDNIVYVSPPGGFK